MNLLTMIPVQWDNEEYKYYVGFQVDLVEQPGSVAGRNPGKDSMQGRLIDANSVQMDPTR